MQDIIKLENKFYIAVNSTYADDRVRVLNHTDTFGIFDRWGDVKQLGEEVQGIYHNGTRFISDIEFRINGYRPMLLSSSIKEGNEILSVDLTNPLLTGSNDVQTIQKGLLYIGRSKFVYNGSCYEQITFYNFSHESHEFTATLSFNADFKDIFEVRGMTRAKRGEIYEVKHVPENKILISYLGLDNIKRQTEIQLSQKPDSWDQHNKAAFNIRLGPQQSMCLEYDLNFIIGDAAPVRRNFTEAKAVLEQELKAGKELMATLSTSNEQYNQWINRSQFDLDSLLSDTPYGKYPYAGVPWYNTAFGRDGIITALETLWLAPDIAYDVLRFAAANQATEINAFQDAEPGKIFHEMRGGEMVELEEVPFKRYYGSVDATPLFVVLAGRYYDRTADIATARALWPHVERALEWMEKYADVDGDGFYDYHQKSASGLINQGWKDSYDSISHADGTLAEAPISLCEVQGYVYDAKREASKLARVLGLEDKSKVLEEAAALLKKRFNEQFWDDELQSYALALDGKKELCRVRASNAGHCLYSKIADEDKAEKLVRSMMQEDMFSGWGIRTLSSKEARYNPMSYHNGSVWPHDVALIAKGFSNYGMQQDAMHLVSGLFDATTFIELQRLPELFCGFSQRSGEGPTNYPVACSPQAWSVAAVFLMLEACLNIEIRAEEKRVYFNKPVLPQGMDSITIDRLRLGDSYASLELYCEKKGVGVKVKSCPKDWKILLIPE